ncbi:hypothetical protein [Streptomyces sp. NPDC047070]|uniref:hypothetical protein n=1 Tax=Streptomyces sp. NPDC047070 TaxID=3154923 RepID=UPI003451279C
MYRTARTAVAVRRAAHGRQPKATGAHGNASRTGTAGNAHDGEISMSDRTFFLLLLFGMVHLY